MKSFTFFYITIIIVFALSSQAQDHIGFVDNSHFNNEKIRLSEHIIKKPLSQSLVTERGAISAISLPTLNLNDLRKEAVNNQPDGLKSIEFAKPYKLNTDFIKIASYTDILENGKVYRIYRLLADSANALSLNFGFAEFKLPHSASLFFYSTDDKHSFGPVTSKDNDEHGQYWTPAIRSNKVIVELNIAVEDIEKLKLKFASINQGFLDVYNLEQDINRVELGACNIDVVCPEGDNWRDQINSVAMFQLEGFRACSGGILNNTGRVRRTFLTAEHCNVTPERVPSMVVIWNFHNSFCRVGFGGVGDGVENYINSGARLLATYSPTDMTLVSLDDPIPYNADVFLAGWNRSSLAPTSAVAIHHPALLEKRISFDHDPTIISGYLGNPGNTHIRVIDWDLGTTETGSSGSPLFDQNQLVVGQLQGGFASCEATNESDYYGRIAVSWLGGGSPSTRLKDWLDPENVGETALLGRSHNSIFVADQFEPDNTSSEYNVLNINQTPQRHTLHNPDDIDWFGFMLEERTTVDIVTSGLEGDVYMELYDIDGNKVTSDDDSGANLFARIEQTLEPGSYLIAVVGLNSRGEAEAVEEYYISLLVETDNMPECDFFNIPIPTIEKYAVICL